MKSSIRTYYNEGHDFLTAVDLRNALTEHPVKGTTAAVSVVTESEKSLSVNKIEPFSSLHNFLYEDSGLRVWKCYDIGKGKFLIFWPLTRPKYSFESKETCFYSNLDKVFQLPEFQAKLLVFSVTQFKIDQNKYHNRSIKSRIWEMKEGKYAKTLAKILVTAIFLMRDMRRNFLPKFIEICMEKPCWCPSVWAPTWRPETNRNICH